MREIKGVIILEDYNEIEQHLTKCMLRESPIFFSRIGGSDMQAVKYCCFERNHIISDKEYNYYLRRVQGRNGYFDFSKDRRNFERYLEMMFTFYKNSDDCSFAVIQKDINRGDTAFYEYLLKGKTIIDYNFIEWVLPFLKSFSVWAKGKRILFINPFEKSIQYQWKRKDQLYLNYTFPEFELLTYNTSITYNNSEDSKDTLKVKTNNWFEEARRMIKEISRIDFDIAILSCASYSMYIGMHIRNVLKKKAFYLGGIVNVLFNIYGGRYSDKTHPNSFYRQCGLNPEFTIDPFENEDIVTIKGGRGSWSESLNGYFGRRN